jgi:hypothetical protein
MVGRGWRGARDTAGWVAIRREAKAGGEDERIRGGMELAEWLRNERADLLGKQPVRATLAGAGAVERA